MIFFLYSTRRMQKTISMNMMAHTREVNSFAPKYSEGEKEMNLQLFARTPETTKAISALVPKTLNGVKGFAMP